ncbi:AfsR/SARP family transcriptional regulator [Amycolatopsis taiwanensis]|uniref:AfsR/SARP family transcriptional regulator n=1 Tax=Amycolatopsis taiwanensis TaxID=342230 RepID=UPI0004AEF2F2|nr:BTAD domain-containing putative transcriptional regulator [Amycolatopsis taiwanensis]
MEAIGGEPAAARQVLVLGPVGVGAGDEVFRPSSAVAARLLAALATRSGQAVPDDVLRAQVWPGDPGDRGAKLAVTVHRLRGWLKTVAGSAIGIGRGTDGYVLEGDTDAAQFGRLVAARQVDPQKRVEALAEALRLWRGPLPDFLDPAAAAALERTRREVIGEYGRLLLESGRTAAALAIVEEPARTNPLDEDLQAVRIEALAMAGRRADALAAYHELRRQLRDELGVHPGPRAQAALSNVLGESTPAVPWVAPRPAQLPRMVTPFRGRARQLAELDGLLATAASTVVTVTGTRGCGKTALATRWAHQIAEEFPDGQVFLDLHGSSDEPSTPVRALASVLRSLGEPHIASDADEAGALFRSVTAEKSLLLVLDDAASAEQVRPLLPGASTCLTVVTSRYPLDELTAVDGAARVELDALPADEAVALLAALLGEEHADDHSRALTEFAEACERMPMTLRTAATALHSHLRQTVVRHRSLAVPVA